ncbi:hypothetical protein GCM10028807_57990 [Spirosoma daeguense]
MKRRNFLSSLFATGAIIKNPVPIICGKESGNAEVVVEESVKLIPHDEWIAGLKDEGKILCRTLFEMQKDGTVKKTELPI